jgi:hypothetical protein
LAGKTSSKGASCKNGQKKNKNIMFGYNVGVLANDGYNVGVQRRSTGKRWITVLIKKLWEISWNMWEQRNGELKNPASPASLQEHARLDAKITIEYEDVSTLYIRDRRWFRRPKEVLFTESLEYKTQWLELVCLACNRYA